MTQAQDRLTQRIGASNSGRITVRLYHDGRGRREWNAAQGLRAQGIIGMRGVRTPRDANFEARSIFFS